MDNVGSTHEGWCEWFAFFVEREGVEGKVDVCDDECCQKGAIN